MKAQFAFDRSQRTFDREGRLRVSVTPISKANIRPYFGREVPFANVFDLDPEHIYQMFCPPDELAKAAPTSNNIQLLDTHIGVSARDPQTNNVVGALGTDGTFTAPYLTNSICVWDKSAIDGIVSGAKRELSLSYSYTPVMTSGTYLGKHYDGYMADINCNHCALVVDGRAGSDVLVSDAMPIGMKGDTDMTLREKLLAKMEASGASKALMEEMRQLFDDDMTEDDLDETVSLQDQMEPRGGKMEPRGEDRALLAMDMITTDSYRKMRAFTTAQAMVRPLVGEIMAADAAQVIKAAIRKLGYGDVLSSAPPREALPALWKIVVARHRGVSPTRAMDAQAAAAFNKKFPDVARVQGTGLANFGVPSRIDNFGQRRR